MPPNASEGTCWTWTRAGGGLLRQIRVSSRAAASSSGESRRGLAWGGGRPRTCARAEASRSACEWETHGAPRSPPPPGSRPRGPFGNRGTRQPLAGAGAACPGTRQSPPAGPAAVRGPGCAGPEEAHGEPLLSCRLSGSEAADGWKQRVPFRAPTPTTLLLRPPGGAPGPEGSKRCTQLSLPRGPWASGAFLFLQWSLAR